MRTNVTKLNFEQGLSGRNALFTVEEEQIPPEIAHEILGL